MNFPVRTFKMSNIFLFWNYYECFLCSSSWSLVWLILTYDTTYSMLTILNAHNTFYQYTWRHFSLYCFTTDYRSKTTITTHVSNLTSYLLVVLSIYKGLVFGEKKLFIVSSRLTAVNINILNRLDILTKSYRIDSHMLNLVQIFKIFHTTLLSGNVTK